MGVITVSWCVEYFAGKAGLLPYRLLYVAVLLVAPVLTLDLVWKVADILNALMAIPNLTAVLLLSPVIVKETKKYIKNLDAVDHTPIPVVKNRKRKKKIETRNEKRKTAVRNKETKKRNIE